MSDKYKIIEPDRAYFLTLTVVEWVDVFTRNTYRKTIVDSLAHCQKSKGLVIFGWCLMTNHLHLIARADGSQNLSEILRDFKKFTSKKIIDQIIEGPESRSDRMLSIFRTKGENLRRIKGYKFWQDGNHAEIIFKPDFFYQKLNYIHQNPVVEGIVEKPEDYLYSSARNYAELDSLVDVILESPRQITY